MHAQLLAIAGGAELARLERCLLLRHACATLAAYDKPAEGAAVPLPHLLLADCAALCAHSPLAPRPPADLLALARHVREAVGEGGDLPSTGCPVREVSQLTTEGVVVALLPCVLDSGPEAVEGVRQAAIGVAGCRMPRCGATLVLLEGEGMRRCCVCLQPYGEVAHRGGCLYCGVRCSVRRALHSLRVPNFIEDLRQV